MATRSSASLRAALVLAALLPSFAAALAEGDDRPAPSGAACDPPVEPRAEQRRPRGLGDPLLVFGLQHSYHQRSSISLGALVGREIVPDVMRGVLGVVEWGQGGRKLMLGVGDLYADVAAWSLRASWYRTSRRARALAAGQDYLGFELKGTLMGFNAMIGGYAKVAGDPGPTRAFVTVGVGLGL